tara:strand:- start:18 stop:338 length:321 start_codon:yes stop_codon:yes gene_type:complete
VCPAGSANPSTDSLNRTTTLSGVISALFTDVNALITAEATSFRTSAVLHAFGNHATWTNGIYLFIASSSSSSSASSSSSSLRVLFLYPTEKERERKGKKRIFKKNF